MFKQKNFEIKNKISRSWRSEYQVWVQWGEQASNTLLQASDGSGDREA